MSANLDHEEDAPKRFRGTGQRDQVVKETRANSMPRAVRSSAPASRRETGAWRASIRTPLMAEELNLLRFRNSAG